MYAYTGFPDFLNSSTASRISCTFPQYGDSNPVGFSSTEDTRASTLALRRLSTILRTVGAFEPRRYPTTLAGATSVRSPPTLSTSVLLDATDGSRPTARYRTRNPAIDTNNANPRTVKM